MVFFACNHCGESLKKNKVDTHLRCRPRSVSCMDCSKDFLGDQYKNHTTCVSEDKKYGGVNYQGKEEPKGQKKQDQWVENIRCNLHKARQEDQSLLRRIIDQSNVPRKQAKFKNFVASALNTRSEVIVSRLWSFIESVNKPATSGSTNQSEPGVENQQPPTKKVKLDCSHDLEVKLSSEHAYGNSIKETSVKPFKWLKYAKQILREDQTRQLKRKDLKTKLRNIYLKKYDDSDINENQMNKVIDDFLNNPQSAKLETSGNVVKLIES